jgi:hypothetical protein
MTPSEALKLAHSYSVEVRLNAAGDGLDLEIESDPPPALMNILKRIKWDIVEALRQQETEARTARGLNPLPELFERYRSLLETVQDSRPPDVGKADWEAATRGLRAFLASGRADEALRLGWPHDELFQVPPVWARVELCGAALLIGDREVTEITPAEIRIKTPSGATLAFYRKPTIDYRLVFETRLKVINGNYAGDSEEPRLRALEYTVRFCCDQTGLGLEEAKKIVLAAIERVPAR